jgi:hypothetical protein
MRILFLRNLVLATLVAQAVSPAAFSAEKPVPLDLVPGGIEYQRVRLEPKPALEVEVSLPASLSEEDAVLEILQLPEKSVVEHRKVKTPEETFRFTSLGPGGYAAELKTSKGTFRKKFELRAGVDEFLRLEPDLIEVRGRVFCDDEPCPGSLAFRTISGEERPAEADEEGRYEVSALMPFQRVSIEVEGREQPYLDFFARVIRESGERNFLVPMNQHRVKVLDLKTGLGVGGARVSGKNYFQQGEEGAGPALEKAVAQQAVANDEGEALLPPLRAGRLELRASAEGYFTQGSAVDFEVPKTKKGLSFEIFLEPVGETAELRFLLPDGSPAEGARVGLCDTAGRERLSAVAGADGRVGLPRQEGLVIATHPRAAFLVRTWDASAWDSLSPSWVFEEAVPSPLSLRILDASGQGAAPQAGLALWVHGYRLSGLLLAVLTRSSPFTDRVGFWRADNLPPGPLRLLAWHPSLQQEAQSGALDAFAVEIPYPWPEIFEAKALN